MRSYPKNIFFTCCIVFVFACKEKLNEVDYVSNQCTAQAPFLTKIISNINGIAFSTSENREKGLWLINATVSPDAANRKIYQDTSWKMAGWLGPLLTDKKGNIWCAPVPVINVLDNKPEDQNKLYRVDATTGKMELFIELPKEKSTIENPYGILGLAYNCEANVLYVSSVAGSTRNQQNGKIYCIDVVNKTIQSTLNCGDAFGIGVSFKDGFRKLYFGSARNSNIYSIGLKENGSFLGESIEAFSIDGLGPRGDDKAKKIREDKNGNLTISGYEFNFNLTAPTEKQETLYNFSFDSNNEKWVYKF
jgi:hypothetical protein